MQEYTWEDLIINLTLEEARNCIGMIVYYADSPSLCLKYANNNNVDYAARLTDVISGNDKPFYFGEYRERAYGCIIPKKEEEHEYVPFESADEFLNAYENSKYDIINVTTEYKLISCGGIWLKSKCKAIWIIQCTEVTAHGIAFGHTRKIILWKELLNGYRFLDGTPCGKKKE